MLPKAPTKPSRQKLSTLPRYYRCRGDRACHGTQISADDIEQRILAWLRKPTGAISRDASFVLTRYAPIWEVLFPQVVSRLVAQLVWEVRWGGRKGGFTVLLDETAIAEEHAKLKLATRSKRPGRCLGGRNAGGHERLSGDDGVLGDEVAVRNHCPCSANPVAKTVGS